MYIYICFIEHLDRSGLKGVERGTVFRKHINGSRDIFACFNAGSLCKPIGALDEQMGPRVGKGKHEMK